MSTTDGPECARKGCGAAGTHRPVLLLLARREAYRGRREVPIRAQMGILVCEAHCDPDAATWITDEGWRKLVGRILAVGKAPPQRTRTRVLYERVVEPS